MPEKLDGGSALAIADNVCAEQGHSIAVLPTATELAEIVICTKCGLSYSEIRKGEANQ